MTPLDLDALEALANKTYQVCFHWKDEHQFFYVEDVGSDVILALIERVRKAETKLTNAGLWDIAISERDTEGEEKA